MRRHTTREQRGGTTTTRAYFLAPLPEELSRFRDAWSKLKSIGQVITTVEEDGETKIGVRF